MNVIWAPLAIEQVVEISEQMAQENKEAALAWAGSLFGAIKKLEQFPEMGRRVPEIKRKSIRELLHGKYRVLYRLEKDEVAILSVRHGRRKLRARDISQGQG